MILKRHGSQPSMKGPEQYFTGTVRIDMLNAPPAPARVSAANVTFEPGARTAWHTYISIQRGVSDQLTLSNTRYVRG